MVAADRIRVPIIAGPHAGESFDIPIEQRSFALAECEPQPIRHIGASSPISYVEPRTVRYEIRRRRCRGSNSTGPVEMRYAVPDYTDKDDTYEVERYFAESLERSVSAAAWGVGGAALYDKWREAMGPPLKRQVLQPAPDPPPPTAPKGRFDRIVEEADL